MRPRTRVQDPSPPPESRTRDQDPSPGPESRTQVQDPRPGPENSFGFDDLTLDPTGPETFCCHRVIKASQRRLVGPVKMADKQHRWRRMKLLDCRSEVTDLLETGSCFPGPEQHEGLLVRSVDILSHYGLFGGNTTFPCSFHSSGRTKFFCRETCEGENLLIRTSDDTAQIGRYRTEYVREASRTFSVLSVSISELTRSDAGRYRCGLEDSPSPASFQDFRLVVVDDLLDGNKVPDLLTEAGSSVTVACSFEDSGRKRLFCRGECGNEEVLVQTDGVRADRGRYSIEYEKRQKSAVLLVTITQLVQSDSGRYRCKLDRAIRSDLDRDFYITVTDALQDRISSSANAPNNIYGAAGEEVRVQCTVSLVDNWKFFCKENCEGENILIKTRQSTDQRGRYRTENVKQTSINAFLLHVSISELTRSDEGWYRCGSGDSSSSGSYQDFRLVVVDDLLDGNKVPDLLTEAGSSVTVTCSFKHSGRKRRFCRGECGNEEVLVQTDGVRADRGRYSIEYEEQKSGAFLLVTITQLVQSDSGRYRCKLDGTGSSSSYRDFQVTVRTGDPSASTASTGTSFSSSSGSFTPSLPSETSDLTQENSTSKDSPNHRRHEDLLPSTRTKAPCETQSNKRVNPPTGSADVLRFVALTLVFIIILSAVVLLVCCRERSEKHHTGSSMILVLVRHRSKNSKMNEDVTEEADEWRSADVKIYSSYNETTNTKPTEAEINRGCSSGTATTTQQPSYDA
ncbi:hypothetical protein CCH79_00018975 [Gambusia affinis]|uniref:Immunoglobulin domain-containing protein n=1 Tax=Gambusia affinis TaxID=33528 RepID=A0A315VJR8_GAMAF|nr:hypothetical protein CCH79_00018975 [Gambusia affinis]